MDASDAVALAEKLWSRVERTVDGECWLRSTRSRNGYSYILWHRQQLLAHRVAWEVTFGPIPAGFEVCHRCDNRACCNPSHLFVGTHADNMGDARQKGRMASGMRNGARTRPDRFPQMQLDPLRACGIMARLLQGVSHRQVAREFGVSKPTAGSIWRGETWADIFQREEAEGEQEGDRSD